MKKIKKKNKKTQPRPKAQTTVVTSYPQASEKAISAYDPLKKYMQDLKKYPVLEPDEELKLAQRLKEKGDLDAAKLLVSANLKLVVKIAFEYRNFYSTTLDLIQEGNIGLMKAVSKFDPTKGARLGYYASWWIRSYILKYLIDNFRLVKIGTTQAQKKLFYQLMKEKQLLEAQGITSAPKLLADRLNVKEKEVIEMDHRLSAKGAEMSLDAPIQSKDGSKTLFTDLLVDDSQLLADQVIEKQQLLNILNNEIPKFTQLLNEKEAIVLSQRILSSQPKTLQEIADYYSLTRERVRQIETKVIQKLKEYLKPHLSPK